MKRLIGFCTDKVALYAPKTVFNLQTKSCTNLSFESDTIKESAFVAFNDLIASSATALLALDKSEVIPVETPKPFNKYANTAACSEGLIIPL